MRVIVSWHAEGVSGVGVIKQAVSGVSISIQTGISSICFT